jgi:hypothetical protein
MNPVMSVMRMHLKEKFLWFILPWIIVMSSFLINLGIAVIVPMEEGLYTGGLSSIFIYMFVAGIVGLAQTFPFALGFSVRRTDYYWGTAIVVLLASALNSLILVILSVLEKASEGWGTGLHFYHLPYLSDGSVVERFWIYLLLFLFMYFAGFGISSVYRRFGRSGMYAFFIVLSLLVTIAAFICTYYAWWDDIFTWFLQYSALDLANWTMVPAAACLLLSYWLLRRSTV